APARVGKLRLWAEFVALFIATPIAVWWFASGGGGVFSVLLAALVVGGWLLHGTPGWRWRRLIEGPVHPHWRATLGFTIGTVLVVGALTLWLRPASLFAIPLYRPELMLLIALAYPILSALPQEILFRALFFERYGPLFGPEPGGGRLAVFINGLIFGLAHLYYANAIAIGLSVLAGWLFADAYLHRRSFPLALLWHVIGGLLVFAIGLGGYFYAGAR
ncbi:MAG: CPBP family intramembrane glutamic endopeptidase, partial [Pseudomonadota bacterium]